MQPRESVISNTVISSKKYKKSLFLHFFAIFIAFEITVASGETPPSTKIAGRTPKDAARD